MDNVYFDLTKEGIVLLKNDNNTLPLSNTDNVSVFGRCQYDLFYVGYGSGNVNDETRINIIDGLNNYNINYNHDLALIYQNYSKKNKVHDGVWGLWPTSHPELVLSNDIVSKSKEISNKAVYIIGRCFGEDMDEPLTKGGYYLTDTEINNLKLIEEYYDDYIILINSGNIIDLSFLKDFHPKSILYVWFPGSLAGNAIGAILKGTDSPSGKMPVTVATSYNDYITSKNFGNKEKTHYYEDIFVGYRYFLTFAKDKILYPFGYGCSYTNFSIKVKDAKYINNKILISVICKNIGIRCGKDVIQIYVSSPVNKLSKASKVLVAFKKTKLLKPLDEEIKIINKATNKEITTEDVIEYMMQELQNRNVHVKGKTLDLLVKTKNNIYDLEINNVFDEYVRKRNYAYMSNLYSNLLEHHDSYLDMPKLTQI